MTTLSGLAMSWQEWHKHDAVALAELVRAGQVAPKELCAQPRPRSRWASAILLARLALAKRP